MSFRLIFLAIRSFLFVILVLLLLVDLYKNAGHMPFFDTLFSCMVALFEFLLLTYLLQFSINSRNKFLQKHSYRIDFCVIFSLTLIFLMSVFYIWVLFHFHNSDIAAWWLFSSILWLVYAFLISAPIAGIILVGLYLVHNYFRKIKLSI